MMDVYDVARLLSQVEPGEGADFLNNFLRANALQVFLRIMEAEVEGLCGAFYHPNDASDCCRGGSAPGAVLHEGRRVNVTRPRVRRKTGGKSEEVRLASYEAAREPGRLEAMFLRSLATGTSTRSQAEVYPESPSASKSSISRLWMRGGAKLLEEFRVQNIDRNDWLILMLDGVRLAKELWAIVALGVAEDGTKHMLDFEIGASENTEVATSLCQRLRERGFVPKEDCRLLCVLDGGKALRKATKKVWGDPVLQRCLVHKERNLRGYLSKRHWGELSRLMKRLREVEGEVAAREALEELRTFLKSKNTQAFESLEEAGDELIAVHLLGVPNTLHKNLLSTNIIENSIRNVRGSIGRVKRWRNETDQPLRWMGLAMTNVNAGFRRLAGYRDLPRLAEALKRPMRDKAAAA